MPGHYLDPLLKPGSIALVGASEREGSPGNVLARNVIESKFTGAVYPVNPRSRRILGVTCHPDLASIPEDVDHAVLAVSNARLEATLAEAAARGVKAVTIYSDCFLEDDTDPPLKQRLAGMAKQAGMAVCGGNGMGFYNVRHELYAGMYPFPGSVPGGGITLIAQSGSAFSTFAHNGCRLGFNLCVSSGNELVTTTADYMSWALAQDDTRVIGIFLETVRDPAGFIDALRRAAKKRIPVVILKVGKSPLGAAMAHTHTGAVAGDHAAYEALFRKYGVIEVRDFDEMGATLMMLQSGRVPGPGGLAAILESGGFREFLADRAHELGIHFGAIGESTRREIAQHLEPGLVAENPLDAWGTRDNFESRFAACLSALMRDDDVALGMMVSNFRDDYFLSEALYRNVAQVAGETDKPLAIVSCYADVANDDLSRRTAELGIPMIDGAREALLAAHHLFAFRDFDYQPAHDPAPAPGEDVVNRWRARLAASGGALGEAESLALLSDFAIATPGHARVRDTEALQAAARRIGYPVALKTAAGEVHHKTDQGGVLLNLADENELLSAYHELRERLGPEVLVSAMAPPGTEVGLGVVNDDQFGPFVMVAAGGELIEVLRERVVCLAPVSAREAEGMLASLPLDALLRGVRGRPAQDRDALAEVIVRLSVMAHCLRDVIREIDVNPVIVSEHGALAVDGLVLTR